MAKVMMRNLEETEFGGIEGPLFSYGIEADSYEEAKALAMQMLNEDATAYAEEQKAKARAFLAEHNFYFDL